MNQEKLLLQKLEEISSALQQEYQNTNEMGVLSGRAGIALFQFYYSKFLQDEKPADVGVEILSSIIEAINNGYNFHTYCSGIAGAGWVIDLLQEEDLIDLDCDELLSTLDGFLVQSIKHMQDDQNFFDFLHGVLGVGYYFLKRYTNTKSNELRRQYEEIINDIIVLLQDRSDIEDDTAKWESYLIREEDLKGYNLSLAHGNTSIINFLSRLAAHDAFKDKVEMLLHQSVRYILGFKNEDRYKTYSFPSWVTTNNDPSDSSRLAWCYGDLGIAMTLWRAGKQLDTTEYKDVALQVLRHAAKRKDLEEAGVKDAGLCHGALGIMHIYTYMYKESSEPLFKETAEYWMDQALNMSVHATGHAGYLKWQGGDNPGWVQEINLLEGTAGIGLSILSYLAPFETKWDQCLLIG
ncbi:lanthionine synthetase C family protein [Aquimarina gracilis]|uniref:Lanthionine synthetase C family protein n=1 Tax=Aquimarina gracilis TaxID=874422 RepID=A0ABU5ZZM5_9FLAO|nr:lanthionine synthetase C family protein [Aquimarina gracilis]MEB3347281.1 lanthionine synthetase C family protein [Aquimarina gracilis]